MAFFDDMINGIHGMFGGKAKSQNSGNNANSNINKGVSAGVFNGASQSASFFNEEERRRREAERLAQEEARKREDEERKAREEEERRKAEEERKRQEAERQRAELERQKRVEYYKNLTARGEFNAQNEYNRQFESLRKEKLKRIEDQNGWFNNTFDGAGKQREELAKTQAHNELVKKLHDEGMIDYADGDKKVQQLVMDRGGRNRFNYNFLENASRNFKDNQRAFDTGREMASNESLRKLNGLTGTANDLIDRYNNLSGDDQAEIREHLQKLQYKYTQNNDVDKASTTAQLLGLFNKDQNSLIKQKDTSTFRQIGKTASSGGFIGDLAKPVENLLASGSTMLGNDDIMRKTRISQQIHDIDNSNTGAVGTVNKGFEMAANLGLNASPFGKAKVVTDVAGGWAGAVDKAEGEKVLDYDENGNPYIRNKNSNEKIGAYGSQVLNTGLAAANLKGIGVNMGSLDGLNKVGVAKELGKYYAKEVPYSAITGYLNANLDHMANGGNFGDADMGQIAGGVLQDIVLDTGMDLRGAMGKNRTVGGLKNLPYDVRNLYKYQDSVRNKIITDEKGRYVKGENLAGFDDISNRNLPKASKTYLDAIRNDLTADTEIGKVGIHNEAPGKFAYSNPKMKNVTNSKLRMTPQIDELLEATQWSRNADGNLIRAENQLGKHPDIDYWNYGKVRYEAPDPSSVQYEGVVNVGVGKNNDKNFYSITDIEQKKKATIPNERVKVESPSNTSNIPQSSEKVNGNYEYSDEIRLKQDDPRKQAQFELSQKPLLATHNLSADGLKYNDENGGAVTPSIGISKPDNTDWGSDFGDISLVADKPLIDRKRGVYLYNGDGATGSVRGGNVYSPQNSGIDRLKNIEEVRGSLYDYPTADEIVKNRELSFDIRSDIVKRLDNSLNTAEKYEIADKILQDAIDEYDIRGLLQDNGVKRVTDKLVGNLEQWATNKEYIDNGESTRATRESYAEAKLDRVVGLDEFKHAVIPNNLDAETRSILEKNGIKTTEYEAGNIEDRQAKLNELNHLKFKVGEEIKHITATMDELRSRHQNLTGDEDLVFNIFKDEIQKNALGYFDPKTNKINLNDLTTDTLNHEIGHKIFSRVPMEQKADLISEIRSTFGDEALISKYGKDYGDDINILAEERLADGFSEYFNGKLNGEDGVRLGQRLGIPPKVLAYYDRMVEAIKSVFNKTDELRKFYAEIETGKYAKSQNGAMQGAMAYKINPQTGVVEIENDILRGVKPEDRRQVIKNFFQNNLQGNNYELNHGFDGEALINARSRNKYLDPNQTIDDLIIKGRMTGELPDILKVSQKIGQAKDSKSHSFAKDGFEYRKSTVKIGEDYYNVRLNVGINGNNKLFYTINGIEKIPTSASVNNSRTEFKFGDFQREPWNREDTRLNHSSYANSVSQNAENVKYKNNLSDRFGNTFTEENIPVSQLYRDKQFQPRTTASGKGTSDSVFNNGFNEGMVDQPFLVRKTDKGYQVLGGHSRTEGLERRAQAGLSNPDQYEEFKQPAKGCFILILLNTYVKIVVT